MIDLPTERIYALSQWQTFIKEFYLQDGGKNQLEQNYVTVTLCIPTGLFTSEFVANCSAVHCCYVLWTRLNVAGRSDA